MAKKIQIKARVTVYPRPEILDPQGNTIRDALLRLGFEQVMDVRAGKSLEISLSSRSKKITRDAVEQMCERLLANPVIEDYKVELLDE